MPYDEKGRFWTENRGGIFITGNTCYKPPPDYGDEPSPSMPHGKQEEEWYQLVQFCEGCLEDVLNGDIEFKTFTIINVVPVLNCDNFDPVEEYCCRVANRDKVLLTEPVEQIKP